ncbi:hypothetical protein Ddye_024124 [Dipteronia dyeriana]|uniref:SWIM-type domain-containing protein n=1 Tax=Dipteronia dyeriana TaxID=168575 RepID=A0AAD9WTA3_9ROSI|nr:hypothetical protein Ddye_024124 [Dipteronia dyeriana]
MYGGQSQAASANVIGQLYASKLSSGANICPKDIMRNMMEKHGVELLYTKAWMAMQHARSTVYSKEARKLPITALVEFLRDLMQKWFHDRRKAANKGSSILTDFALEHIKSNQEKSQLCIVQPIDYTKYAVKDNEGKVWTVDLELRTCTCRMFDLNMLPCAHAIVVYIDYFTTQWLQTAYAPSIHQVPHPSSWVFPEHVSSCVVHPPECRRQSGRPKTITIRSSLEESETRICTNYGESGHNHITCTKPCQTRSFSKSSSSSVGQKPPFRRQPACGRCMVLGHNIQACSNLEAKP